MVFFCQIVGSRAHQPDLLMAYSLFLRFELCLVVSSSPAGQLPELSLLSLSLPVAMGYVPLGMIFGFLLVQAGADGWMAPAMSLFVFAGAAQFMAVPMLAADASLWAIALATLVINLRHVFYGLSLLHRLPRPWWARTYLIFALSDENYSVITSLPASTPARRVVGVAAFNHGWWVLGSAIGAIIGTQVNLPFAGLDFSLAALFAVLAVEQYRGLRKLLPIVVALLSYGLASYVFPAQALLISLAIALLAACFLLARPSAAAYGKDF